MALNPYIFLSDNPLREAPEGGQKLDSKQLDAAEELEADFFLLDGSDVVYAAKMLRKIRQHQDNSIYLKPVFLERAGSCADDTMLAAAVDAVCQEGAEGEIINGDQEVLVNGINARLKEMQKNLLILGDQQTTFRLLRFMATRNVEQKPKHTSARIMGYNYPPLEPFFPEDDKSVWNMLDLLEEQHMVSARFITRSYQCVHCQSSFLNFIETCPDCKAVHIEGDDLMHHFRCGYSAAAREFASGGQLVCPKCKDTLKQIGVDYDKPSLTFRCKECQYIFEEPFVSTECYHCGRRTDPAHQVQRTIYAYYITALGENAALFGPEQLFNNILGDQLKVFEYDAFNRFVDTESARIARYKLSASCVLIMEIQGFADAMAALGQRSTELYKELADIFAEVLRTSDIISTRGQSIFIMLLVETSEEASNIAVSRLTERIEKLFQDSLSLSANLLSHIEPVQEGLDLNKTLEFFLTRDDRPMDKQHQEHSQPRNANIDEVTADPPA